MQTTNTISKSENNFVPNFKSFDFLWLELTSRCNLECVHCYADSSPMPKQRDKLTSEKYFDLINQASYLGCHQIQFIGGEPTIVKELPALISHAKNKGFDFIEVYTNAVNIKEELLSCFVENNVKIAASFYSYKPEVHDSITQRKGSFSKTSETLTKLANLNLDVRVGIIAMEENKDDVENTINYINGLGIKDVSVDRMRSFGRGSREDYNDSNAITELCGSCWKGSLCVFPDGKVAPCIMSKNWNVGSVLENDLEEILQSISLENTREKIYEDVWLPISNNDTLSDSKSCHPNLFKQSKTAAPCLPGKCDPQCVPTCGPSCNPCAPSRRCNPYFR